MAEDSQIADLTLDGGRPEDADSSGNWIQVVTVIFVVLALVLLSGLQIFKQNKKAAMIETSSNVRSIYYLMIEFDQDYGEFPNDANAVDELQGLKGEYSNEYFAQLITGGFTMSEEVFYAKGGASVDRKPDNVLTPPARILEAGECGFAFVEGSSSASNDATPLALAPMKRNGFEFDPSVYLGKAVVLRVDGSVKHHRLNSDNRAAIGGGWTLFQGGKGTVWGEAGFDVNRLKYAK